MLKGTRVATAWEPLRDRVWRTPWKTLFPARPADWWQRGREGMRTPLHRFNNDMVFVDGEMLQSAGWEGGLDERSYSIDYEGGYVYIGVDPAKHLVEITAFDSALIRTTRQVHGKASDGRGPTIRGLTLTQYAYRAIEIEGREADGPADPATFGKEVVGTTLEHVTISYCSRVAGYFHGDRLTIRHCLISDTSTEGIYIISSADCLLERNIFRRNNVERLTGYYPAAVKIFNQSYRVTCRDNLVIDQPYSNGIWYDVGNVDGVFVNNWIEGALDGFFFEISKGAIVAGNVFVRCDKGIRVLNSCERPGVSQHVRRRAGVVRAERTERGRRPLRLAPCDGPRRGQARRPRVRRQPARGRREIRQAAGAVRTGAGAVREAHSPPRGAARRQRLRAAKRSAADAPLRLEPGDGRAVPDGTRLARRPPVARAGRRAPRAAG